MALMYSTNIILQGFGSAPAAHPKLCSIHGYWSTMGWCRDINQAWATLLKIAKGCVASASVQTRSCNRACDKALCFKVFYLICSAILYIYLFLYLFFTKIKVLTHSSMRSLGAQKWEFTAVRLHPQGEARCSTKDVGGPILLVVLGAHIAILTVLASDTSHTPTLTFD